MTGLTGGVIDSKGLNGQSRDQLFSNLDWTPTLLDFAGLLDCIDVEEYTWDGISQRDLILNNEEYISNGHKRKLLILNIGDKQLSSGSMLLDYEGTLFKFIIEDDDKQSEEDQERRDSWSTIKVSCFEDAMIRVVVSCLVFSKVVVFELVLLTSFPSPIMA